MKIAIINLSTRTPLVRSKVPKIKSNRDNIIVKFAEALQKEGIDLDLFVSDAYKPIVMETLEVKVIYVKTLWKSIFWPSRLPFVPTLFSELRNKYDIVVCIETFQWSTILAVLAKLFSSKKQMKIIIWQELSRHQQLLKSLPSLLFYKVILKVFLDKYISTYIPRSIASKKFLLKQKINRNKIASPISHGFDPNIFFFDPKIKKENYIFSPSILIDVKGIDVLLNAFAIAQRVLDNIKLLIQGAGPKLEEYKALSKRLKIDKRVEFYTKRIDHNEMRIK
jgi:1,2-diacylglycerol 3-alpha-glucosyltransferase